jgi:hypothetical protein
MVPNKAMLKPNLAYAVTNFLDVFGDSRYLFLSSTQQKKDYSSDGTSSQTVGNFTYSSDGTTCHRSGNQVFCD